MFDAVSRTLKLRLEVTNSGLTLRPDLFVDVEFAVKLPSAVTVPSDAVLDSGLRKTVFIDRGGGFFEPRPVQTGARWGDRVVITQGVKAGGARGGCRGVPGRFRKSDAHGSHGPPACDGRGPPVRSKQGGTCPGQ